MNVINYIYDNFEYVNVSDYIQNSFAEYQKYYQGNVHLNKTTSLPEIKLSELDNYDFPLKLNSVNTLQAKFYTLNEVSSAIKPCDKIGCMTIYYEDKILCSMDIVLTNELTQNSWNYYFHKILKEFKFNF